MSALGHKQTFRGAEAMSALPPKADMCGATRDVRFVPALTSRIERETIVYSDSALRRYLACIYLLVALRFGGAH
jgi:hypothetical protein